MTNHKDLRQMLNNEAGTPPEPAWLKQMPREAKDTLLLKLIKQVNLLHGMTRQEVLHLLYTVQRVVHPAGEIIFREGDDSDRTLYILISGKVNVLGHNQGACEETLLASLSPGQTFGEMAIVDGGVRSAMVKAVDLSVSLRVSADRLDRHPEIAFKVYLNIARILSKRLKDANLALIDYAQSLN